MLPRLRRAKFSEGAFYFHYELGSKGVSIQSAYRARCGPAMPVKNHTICQTANGSRLQVWTVLQQRYCRS